MKGSPTQSNFHWCLGGWVFGAHLLILTFVKNTWPLPDWWWRGVLVLCRATFGLFLGVFGKKTQCSLGLLCQFWIDVDQCNLKVVERWFRFKFIQMILDRWKFVSCTPSYSVDLFWILFLPGCAGFQCSGLFDWGQGWRRQIPEQETYRWVMLA